MPKKFDVFISHSSTDVKLADALVLYLENRDIKCWIAPRDIDNDAGLPYAESIVAGIESSHIMVVIFSHDANKSDYVFSEIHGAFNYQLSIIPFRIDGTTMSKKLEFYISHVHWINALVGKPEVHFNNLYKSCANRLGKNVRPDDAQTTIPPTTNAAIPVKKLQGQEQFGAAPQKFDVFISHSSADAELAGALVLYLEERDIKCWVAPRNLNNDADLPYSGRVVAGIEASTIMVVIFSKGANESNFVFTEIERAFIYKLTIIPFKIDWTTVSKKLEFYLSSTRWINALTNKPEDHFYALYKSCAARVGKHVMPDEVKVHPPAKVPSVNVNTPISIKPPAVAPPPVIPYKPVQRPVTKNKPDENEVPVASVKTKKIILFLFIILIVCPMLLCGGISIVGIRTMAQETSPKPFEFVILLIFLLYTAAGCFWTIKFISRNSKFRAAKKLFGPAIDINLTRQFSPFLMTSEFRLGAVLNYFFLIGTIVSFSYSISLSEPGDFKIGAVGIICLVLYISIISRVLSQKNWLTRFKYFGLVLLIVHALIAFTKW